MWSFVFSKVRMFDSERGAALLESSVALIAFLTLSFFFFSIVQVLKLSISNQHLAEFSARVGAVNTPDDGNPIPVDDSALKIGVGPYLPEWRSYRSSSETPAPFSDRDLRTLNLMLGHATVVFPGYETVQGFDAADWAAGLKIPDRQFAIFPMHYAESSPVKNTWRICVGRRLAIGYLVNTCAQASMPLF